MGYGFHIVGGPSGVLAGFVGGSNVSSGPYDRPSFGHNFGRNVRRDLGRDLGQQSFGPSTGVHRPNVVGHYFGMSGPNG